MTTRHWKPWIIAASGATALALSAGLALAAAPEGIVPKAGDMPAEKAIEHAEALSAAFRHAAAKALPSVVQIRSKRVTERQVFNPFEDMFGSPFGRQGPRTQRFEQRGLGSGVIMDKEGHILTNNHVIADSDELEVIFEDGSKVEATVVGADPETDIAVVKVDAAHLSNALQPAVIGDSNKVHVGDWTLAIGSPLELDATVTAGIISAVGRNRQGILRGARGEEGYESFIQTDAAINPGNSGGPLVNLRGEVIGINSAIKSTSGGSIGLGFAIPSTIFRDVADQLIGEGSVRRGYLGVNLGDVTAENAKMLGLDETARGAVVTGMQEDSPAAKAGLKVNDVIVKINGEPVRDRDDLRLKISRVRPGQDANLVALREGKEQEVTVKVGDRGELAGAFNSLGFAVGEVDPKVSQALRLRTGQGVQVTGVRAGSVAEKAGLEAGQVILAINGLPVGDPEVFGQWLARSGAGSRLTLDVATAEGELSRKVLRVPNAPGR